MRCIFYKRKIFFFLNQHNTSCFTSLPALRQTIFDFLWFGIEFSLYVISRFFIRTVLRNFFKEVRYGVFVKFFGFPFIYKTCLSPWLTVTNDVWTGCIFVKLYVQQCICSMQFKQFKRCVVKMLALWRSYIFTHWTILCIKKISCYCRFKNEHIANFSRQMALLTY